MSEHESKQLLRDAGIAVPHETLVRDRAELAQAIRDIGVPLAMKIQSRQIPHKSEIGGVRVNIQDLEAAEAAYKQLVGDARRLRPDAEIQGVLTSPMARRGCELIIGTMRDALFGPMVMVGLGGVATELFKDVVWRPAPVSRADAATMIASLAAAPLLDGFRGQAKADIAALARLIVQVSQLAAGLHDSVSEIEINPVVVHPAGEGVTVLDALVVRSRGLEDRRCATARPVSAP